MEGVITDRRVSLHTDTPQAKELSLYYFIKSSAPFTRENAKLVGGQGDPGWRVNRFKGRVTLGVEPTFYSFKHFGSQLTAEGNSDKISGKELKGITRTNEDLKV